MAKEPTVMAELTLSVTWPDGSGDSTTFRAKGRVNKGASVEDAKAEMAKMVIHDWQNRPDEEEE